MNFLPYTTRAEFLLNVETGLNNGRSNPTIAAALAQHGYDAERMDAGAALLRTAQELAETQRTAYGEQMAATQQLKEAWQTAVTPSPSASIIQKQGKDCSCQTALQPYLWER